MILFTLLAMILIILIAFILVVVSIGGASFIVIFGDVIVCIAIIMWMIKKIVNRKKRR